MKTAYKFLRAGLRSDYDNSKWEIGKWRVVDPPTEECIGLNCSKNIADARDYVHGDILARVEYEGVVIDRGNKLTCEKMRVLKAWKWDSGTDCIYRRYKYSLYEMTIIERYKKVHRYALSLLKNLKEIKK